MAVERHGAIPEIAAYRELFPITKKSVYLNHAGTGPMSLNARKVIEHCTDIYSDMAEFPIDEYFDLIGRSRSTVARLINASPEEIVFTHNTSEGIYIALSNLPFAEGDAILVMDEVFPAVRYVVDNNFPHLEKKYVGFCGKDPVKVVKENVSSRLKAVVLDHVQFLSGERIDLRRLAEYTRSNGIFLVVDGIQSIGALAFDSAALDVDCLSVGGAKWLFGPSGSGFLYISRRNFGILGSAHAGWLGAGWTRFEDITVMPRLYDDARKYEMGTRNVMGILALSDNIKILLQYGVTKVEARIVLLTRRLRGLFEDAGYDFLTPSQETGSGIVTVRPKQDTRVLYERLKAAGIVMSLRNGWLRFSPHFYNDDADIGQVERAIRSC